jgi:hypothetical protein
MEVLSRLNKNKSNGLVDRYIQAIHTQDKDEFMSSWTGSKTDTMISITRVFSGDQAIYQDFLIDLIKQRYSNIDLYSHSQTCHLIDDQTAIVIFAYHTQCTQRDTGEDYGIEGLETQVQRKIGGE